MIDTEALRKKVIDLAIQGKLTEQLPSDGDAETLYAQILNQKSQLIKEGKIKKEKPLPDIAADEIPFEIPKNWKWVRIASVGLTVTGTTPPKENKEYYDGEYPFFKPSDLDAGRHISDGSESLTNEGWKVSRQLRKGSILVCCIGTIGKSAIIDVDGTTNQQINAITPILCDSDYLLYAIENDSFQKQLQQGARATTVTIIKKSKFDECIIPLPALSEQKRIADKLEEVLAQIDIIDDLQAKYSNDLAVLKSKIIDAGIQGKLTEQLPEDGDAETLYAQIKEEKDAILDMRGGRKDKSIKEDDEAKPFEIPNNWKWIRFGEVGLFKKGPFGSALTKSMFVPKSENAVKVYEQQHAIKKDARLGTYYISREYFESDMAGFEVKGGDIIVSCAGTIGETYIMPDDIEQGIINQALMRVTLVDSILGEFFLYYFDSNLKTSARNECNGMAIKNIPPFDVMKNWFFPLPPIAEQKRIVNKIREILALIDIIDDLQV